MQGYDEEPQRREIPKEMFEPSIDNVEWEKAGRPIKPIKRVNYAEFFKTTEEWLRQLEDDNLDEESA